MIVVSDTTAISNLVRIGEIELLKVLFGKILLPKAVYDELLVLEERDINITSLLAKDWFEVTEVTDDDLYQELSLELDIGEVEAIALAIHKEANYLLIDEVKGRRIATEKAVPIIGTLGILLEAKRNRLITSVQHKMDDLKSIGFWINQSLYDRIIELEQQI